MWLYTLIATGRVHSISVDIVNEIFAERIRADAKREPVHDPAAAPPLPPALASSQGPVRGVNHRRSSAYELREAAKKADKDWKKHDEKWWCRHEQGIHQAADAWYREESYRLQKIADERWEVATEESIKAGRPFQQRDGTMWQPPEPPRVGNFERSLQTLLQRIEEGKIIWPPAQ